MQTVHRWILTSPFNDHKFTLQSYDGVWYGWLAIKCAMSSEFMRERPDFFQVLQKKIEASPEDGDYDGFLWLRRENWNNMVS